MADHFRDATKMVGWQPMETAPKDGTWILVLPAGYVRPTAARWYTPEWEPAGRWCLDAEWRFATMTGEARWHPMPSLPEVPRG